MGNTLLIDSNMMIEEKWKKKIFEKERIRTKETKL